MIANRLGRSATFTHVALAAALVVSACGGGGGAGTSTTAGPTVSGTAATGAAISGGTVTLKCVSGTSSASATATDGGFTVDVSGVTLPCVGRVEYKDSTGAAQKLHTFVSAAGVANITPLTELVVANLTGAAPATAFDSFNATAVKAITAAQVSAGIAAVRAYVSGLGIDVTSFPADPLTAKFVAASGTTSGDKADKVLDDLASKLKTGGKKLADAVTDVAKGGSTAASGGTGAAVFTGNSAGKGAYAGVTAANNKQFLDVLAAKCTLDTEFTGVDHVVYRKCKQENSDVKSNVTWSMYLGGLPTTAANATTSGPGALSAATVSAVQNVTDIAEGNACKVAIVEPVIPIVAVQVKGAAYSGQIGQGSFSFNGTSDDSVYVDPATSMVMQFTMTDGKGNSLQMNFDGKAGTANASVGLFDPSGKWFVCQ